MSRFDAIGMFWQDLPQSRDRKNMARPMPPIPETGWRAPRDFPNLSSASALSLDCESYDPDISDFGPGWARGKSALVGASIGTPDGHSWYFPFGHTVCPEQNMPRENVLRFLSDALGNPWQPKIGANLLYDIGTLGAEGVQVAGELIDVQYAEALLTETAKVDLDTLGKKYLGRGKETNVLYEWCSRFYGGEPEDDQRENIWRSPPCLVGPYGEDDARLPFQLYPILYQRLMQEGLFDLFRMECGSIRMLIEMRKRGVTVDVQRALEAREKLLIAAAKEREELRSYVGFDVETNSAQSIAKAFDLFGYQYNRTDPSKNHPNGQPSFTKEFLEAAKNPIAKHVLEIRKFEKIVSTFIDSYVVDSNVNGKVYCQFHPLRGKKGGTRSGRYSSSTPNLQNIPIRDKVWGPIVRSLFKPDDGDESWIKYDYSQIEYRMLIHFAVGPGAEEARRHFNEHPETDYHDMTLDLMAPYAGWDISTPELRKYWRRPTKNINFGLVFGMGEEALAGDLGLSEKEASPIFGAYHKAVPFAKPTMAFFSKMAQELGYIQTILGRRSRFDLWEPSIRQKKGAPRPEPLPYELAIRRWGSVKRAYSFRGLNRVLQGSAADLIKAAMYICHRDGVFAYTGYPRLTVHDELDFSNPGGRDDGFREVKRILESAIRLSIPVKAEVEEGPNWGYTKSTNRFDALAA